HEHYALWEVIEFGDSYEAPKDNATTGSTSDETGKKKGRTVTLTTDDMQKRKNDVNARTTLLLALPDEHQLQFNKHKTAQELWAAILKTFGGNEATKRKKKNLLKAPRSQDRVRRDNYRQGSKVKEQAPKALMVINGVGWDWSYMANDEENHALDLELLKKEKGKLETKLTGFQTASKDLDSLLESQRLDKNKERLGYSDVPPPLAQVCSPPKKDLSWTRLLEFADDTVTNYSRPLPAMESTSDDAQNRNPSISETEASPNIISPKPFIKFVKATDRKFPTGNIKFSTADLGNKGKAGNSHNHIDDKGYWDSGCSRHMTCNISYLTDYEPFDRGYVSFRQGGCKITSKVTIKTGKLEFENVYFVKDLKDFKLLDDANVLLRTPRQHNMYSIDLNNIVPHKDLTCLVAKASAYEGMI
nr:hypothetical protein [Tanacetum cinerariifolium]